MSKILIIEDDETLGRAVLAFLQKRGHEVLIARQGEEGLQLAAANRPDLVILDVMMPGMDGWEVMRRLRGASNVSVLFLTAKGTQEDVIQGLKLGADDYIKKPFNLNELELRIAAILRRTQAVPGEAGDVYDDGYLQVDLLRRTVLRQGDRVHLTLREFGLLAYLVRHRDRVISHAELLREVWGPEYGNDTAGLHVYIRYLREKIEPDPARPRYVCTEWGLGYHFGGGTR